MVVGQGQGTFFARIFSDYFLEELCDPLVAWGTHWQMLGKSFPTKMPTTFSRNSLGPQENIFPTVWHGGWIIQNDSGVGGDRREGGTWKDIDKPNCSLEAVGQISSMICQTNWMNCKCSRLSISARYLLFLCWAFFVSRNIYFASLVPSIFGPSLDSHPVLRRNSSWKVTSIAPATWPIQIETDFDESNSAFQARTLSTKTNVGNPTWMFDLPNLLAEAMMYRQAVSYEQVWRLAGDQAS